MQEVVLILVTIALWCALESFERIRNTVELANRWLNQDHAEIVRLNKKVHELQMVGKSEEEQACILAGHFSPEVIAMALEIQSTMAAEGECEPIVYADV